MKSPSKIIRAIEQGREIRAQRAKIINPKNMKPTIEPGWVIIEPKNHKKFTPKRDDDEYWSRSHNWRSVVNDGTFCINDTYRRRIEATTQQPKPTNKELAACCGLSEQAYQQVKHLTMDQLVSVASLFGTRLRMGLVPSEKIKKGKPKQDRSKRKLIIKFRNVVRRDVEMKTTQPKNAGRKIRK